MVRNPKTASNPLSIPSPDGAIPAVVHLPKRTPAPVVVCCHGLLSYKDSTKFVAIGEAFSSAGMAVVRFDFTGCGESQDRSNERACSSPDCGILIACCDTCSGNPGLMGPSDYSGSSLGGYLSLLAAASGEHRVQAVVCWATPFDFSRIKLALAESEELKQTCPTGLCRLGSPENLEGSSAACQRPGDSRTAGRNRAVA